MTPTATSTAASPPRSALPPLVQLYSHAAAPGGGDGDAELRAAIVAGLRAQPQLTTPGRTDADRAYAFRRTMPTTVMYSEKGLQLYDRLVEEPEYYLWSAELEILSTYAPEIALRAFGHATPGTSKLCSRYTQPKGLAAAASQPPPDEPQHEQERNGRKNGYPLPLVRAKEKWGDQRVGKHNGGVNGEEGLDGKRTVGCASLVELGAGSLRKTAHLVRALQHLPESAEAGKPAVQYYALDLDRAELVRTLEDLHRQEAAADGPDAAQWTVCGGKVGINGMHATYDQGLAHIGAGGLPSDGPRCLLWLGSSIGNFDRRGAADFLKDAAQSALRPGDTMLISIDRRNKPEEVAAAYNDANGKTREFILEGLRHADQVLGGGVLDVSKFEYHDRYNAIEGRHESYYRSTVAQRIEVPGEEPIEIDAGELIHCESSYKFSERETLDTFDYAGLRVVQRWTDKAQRYDVWLVERPAVHFLSTQPTGLIKEPTLQASSWGLPTREDWTRTWKAWDIVTLTMIPSEMLHEKPIDLRHKCIFYIGHIPAFLDLTLSRNLNEPHTHEPYSLIFERGVDPHMDDGEEEGSPAAPANGDTIEINGKQVYCHAHSKVPDKDEDWPTLQELLAYKAKVVARVDAIYDDIASGRRTLDRRLARTLWMTLEHKALHMETLLYMLLQSDKTLPPAGFMPPDWATLQRDWDAADARQGGQRAREQLVSFGPARVVLGHVDDDAKDFDVKASRASSDVADLNEQLGRPEFGWDNETQRPATQCDAFAISAAPISNGQYLAFLQATRSSAVPASWVLPAGADVDEARVRTLYGAVQMSVAHLWPVQASGKELAAYCAWKGGRLPTHVELRRFLDASSGEHGGANCTDRPGANVGFRNWTPVPAQLPRTDHDGDTLPGHNGGVWEWTSSKFDGYDGFRPSALYPAYSADFFDGKHNVLLGGSWATTPSIAGRRTVVNTYQFAYPYVFAGARVVFDQAPNGAA